MILSSHGWDFPCGGADLALSWFLIKCIRDVINTNTYTLPGAYLGQKHFKSIEETQFSSQFGNQLAKLFF